MAARALGLAGAWLGAAHGAAAAEPWLVPQAEVRFSVKLAGKPTHASAGYFVHLPDGGVLPGPLPVPTVVARGGNAKPPAKAGAVPGEVESYGLWHNKTGGMSLVFADPGEGVGAVHIYVTGWNRPRPWTPETGLTPSAILCVEPGEASLQAARGLARPGPVGPAVHARNKAGIERAPLSIGGDDTGRPRPGSFYLLAHVDVTDAGKTWIAPFVLDGECEVRVDGDKLTPRERIDKWGGTGQYFELDRGLHRLEVFQTAPGKGPYVAEGKEGGLMYLTWRTPNATMEELGGVRSAEVPMSGTSRMETRVLRAQEIVRSGGCELLGATGRDGNPVPCVQVHPLHSFWFGAEDPLLVYELRALTDGHPAGSSYTWELPGGGKVEGPSVRWLFPGFRDNAARLTATAGARAAQCVQPFYGYCTAATSLAEPRHREAFRAALTQVVAASPASPDPVADWGPAWWNNLIRTTEPGHGYELLHNLFTTRRDIVSKHLSPAQLAMLEDVLLDMMQRRAATEALALADKAAAGAPDKPRRDALLIRKAEIYMYYLGDRDAAARGLAAFSKEDSELAEMARIRLGDIAFLGGDLNQATAAWAEVQARARLRRNRPDGLVTEELLEPAPAGRTSRGRPVGGAPAPAAPTGGEPPPAGGADWKVGALRDVSNSENVVKLIDGGFLLEARQALRAWEREYPLSKVSGDLLLVDARYHMKLGDWQRAQVMLEAYCGVVDASSFLPDAARMLVECARQPKAPRAGARAALEKVRKRLEHHPVAGELERFLADEK